MRELPLLTSPPQINHVRSCMCNRETRLLNYQYTGAQGCASEAVSNGVRYPNKPGEHERGRDWHGVPRSI